MSNKSYPIKKQALFNALEKYRGDITAACKSIDISRVTFYRWKAKYTELADKIAEVHEITLDYVESKLFELIDERDRAAIFFYLKTQGQKRGYIEKYQMDHTSGGEKIQPINVAVTKDENVEKYKQHIDKLAQLN